MMILTICSFLFLKDYPYTSLKEGQIFHDNDTFKVHIVKDYFRVGHGRVYHVWFQKIS